MRKVWYGGAERDELARVRMREQNEAGMKGEP